MFEICFHDLKREVRKRLLEYFEVESPRELNWDTFPIVVIERLPRGEGHVE